MRYKMLGSALGLSSAGCHQTPKCDNQKCLWMSPDVPWRTDSPSVDNHCVKGEECGNNVTNERDFPESLDKNPIRAESNGMSMETQMHQAWVPARVPVQACAPPGLISSSVKWDQ